MKEEYRRFTDEVYADKDEVKAYYNVENVENIFAEILNYRSNFRYETSLKDANDNSYQISLTPKLLKEAYSIEKQLISLYYEYLLLNDEQKNEFALQRRIHILKAIAIASLDKVPSEDTFIRLIKNEIESLSPSIIILAEYNKSLDKKIDHFNFENIGYLNKIIQGDDSNNETIYRRKEKNMIINPLLACSKEDINKKLNELIDFTNDDIPDILKALAMIYFFLEHEPFEYLNEESASIVCKNYLALNNFNIAFMIDFESIALSHSKSFFLKLKRSQDSLDLTYYLFYILPFLNKECEMLKDVINEIKNKESVNDVEITIENKKAIPLFPATVKIDDITLFVNNMLEKYPSLKRKQAHFYATHCTIGLFYTIEQFMKEEHTVYETARVSMDDLALKGFYKKDKAGKKFVYTPIPQDEQ